MHLVPQRFRIFTNKEFARFARKCGISDADLCEAAHRVNSGLSDADLGGGLYKQRIARKGQGKSGGFRTILILRAGAFCIFINGFAKNQRANISPRELAELKLVAHTVLTYDHEALARVLQQEIFLEVFCNEAVPQ